MNYDRAQNILSGQTSLARKVFAAVPMQEYWSIGQISNEMARVEKHTMTKAEISGCLRCLIDAGLVSEAGSLTFRSTVKPPKAVPPKEATVTAPAKKPLLQEPSFMDKLLDLASTLRGVADKIDDVAMQVDTALQDAGKGDEKLRQLQATLRGLMGDG